MSGESRVSRVDGRRYGSVPLWTAVGLLIALLWGVSAIFGGGPRFNATTHVVVTITPLETDQTVDQFDALDQSNALATVVDFFDSEDLWDLALADSGVPESDMDRYSKSVENVHDSLAVDVAVTGPNGRVTYIANSIVTIAAANLEETFPEVDLLVLGSTPAEPVAASDVLILGLVGLGSFLATSIAVMGAFTDLRSVTLDSIKNDVATWVGDRSDGAQEVKNWPRRRLLALGLALGVVAGSFVIDTTLGVGAVGGAFLALGVAFALRYPQWLTVGLVLLVLLRLSDIGTDFFGAPEISIPYAMFVLVVVGIRRFVLDEPRDGWLALALGIFALIAVMSVSGLQAHDQELALDKTFDVAKNGLVAVMMVILIRELAELRTAIWTIIAGTASLAILGIASFLAGRVPGLLEGFAQTVEEVVDEVIVSVRIAGPIGDANFFGQLLVTVFPLAAERAWRAENRILRGLAAAAALLIVGAIILTGSRGALVGLAVSVVLLVVWLRPPAAALVIAAGALVLAPFVIPASYFDRIGTIGQVFSIGSDTAQVDASIQGRTSELIVGVQMFHDHPLVGVGPGNYPGRYVEYSPDVGLDYRAELRQPHSLPVEVAAELGILGLTWWALAIILFGGALTRCLRSSRAADDHDMSDHLEALAIALVGFLVTALFLHLDFARFFWMMVGLTAASMRLARVRAGLAQMEREPVRT